MCVEGEKQGGIDAGILVDYILIQSFLWHLRGSLIGNKEALANDPVGAQASQKTFETNTVIREEWEHRGRIGRE